MCYLTSFTLKKFSIWLRSRPNLRRMPKFGDPFFSVEYKKAILYRLGKTHGSLTNIQRVSARRLFHFNFKNLYFQAKSGPNNQKYKLTIIPWVFLAQWVHCAKQAHFSILGQFLWDEAPPTRASSLRGGSGLKMLKTDFRDIG